MFQVTDSSTPALTAQSGSLAITISPQSLVVTTASLPGGKVGTAYSANLAATGGTAPYKWSLIGGTLPQNLSLSSSGSITGTPTTAGSFSGLTFQVTDSSTPALTAQSGSLSITISPQSLVVTTASLPGGQVGTAYSASLAATGGTAPYKWSIIGGTLPQNLSLSSSGSITGTPSTAGTSTGLTFQVTDSSTPALTAQSGSLSITISPQSLVVTTASLPGGQVGTAYSANLAATGGTAPYKWSLIGGTLPQNLSLSSSGSITGTPTTAGNFTGLTFQVTDSSTPALTAQSGSLSITISPQSLVVTTASLPGGQVGTAYSASLAATGGTAPYKWSLIAGTLPQNLSLSSSGSITGTPTTAGNFTGLTFQVTDSSTPALTAQSGSLAITISPQSLVVTTSSLPSGQVGTAYSVNLVATGGTAPYKWSLIGGTLPQNLSLSSSGSITGTPTTSGTTTGLTFQVTDSSTPALTSQSGSLSITIGSGGSGVSIVPKRAALTITQALSLTATSGDGGNLNWSATGSSCNGASCGTFSSSTTASGAPVTYTAPATAGQFTITATSANNAAVWSSLTVGVTDLAGVATYHNNVSRNGVNSQEYALAPASLTTSTFGKLFSCGVDGAIYAQPLWVPNLTIGGAQHNVILVATQHDSVYAFDADTSPCVLLWHANLIDATHGGTAGETVVGSSIVNTLSTDIQPEIGVTGTPVVDLGTKSLYVVSKSINSTGSTHYQRLHSIDVLTGSEKASGPVLISGTYPSTGSAVNFDPYKENQRPGLALVGGVVYIGWAAHGDAETWYGWLMGYDAATLNHLYTFNSTPNTSAGGIWMGGGAPSADSAGNLYVITGNGVFDATNSKAPNNDYGDSFLQLTGSLSVSQYFTPADQASDNSGDNDFGAGGTSVVVDLPTNGTLPTHLVIGGGKDGYLCLLNRSALGGYSATNQGAVQMLNFGNGIFGTPAYWNWSFYLAGFSGKLQQFTLNSSTYKINLSPTSSSSTTYGFPGATPSITTMPDNSNAIVWTLDNTQYCTDQSPGCGPTVLHAYDATNLGTEFWNSSQGSGNSAGLAVKFTVPTVANGKVYVGTRGDDSEQPGHVTTTPGELDVYGLLPN